MPGSTTNLLQEGLALHRRGALAEAASRYAEVLRADPANADANFYLGMLAYQHRRYAEAAELARKSLAADRRQARAHLLAGQALCALGRHEEALANFDRAVASVPDHAEIWLGRGNVLAELKRHDEALAAYDKALALKPDLADAWLGRGNIFRNRKRYDDSLAAYDQALAFKPQLAAAWAGRGNLFLELQRYGDALPAYDKALGFSPDLAAAWIGRGNVLFELQRLDEALAAYDRTLALHPDLLAAWLGRGNVLFERKQCDEALAAYGKALALKSDFAEAWLGRGNVLFELGQFDDAPTAYDKAVAANPDLPGAWVGRGNICKELMQYGDALTAFDRALALKSDFAEAWLGRGSVFSALQQVGNAVAAYDKAFALKPDLHYIEGYRLHAKLQICDWTALEAEAAHLLAAVRENKYASRPFEMLSIPSTPADQLQCARRYVSATPRFRPGSSAPIYAHERIRVAYVSAAFHEHPTSFLATGLFERHDRSQFEVTGISIGPDPDTAMRRRLKGAFENFVDVGGKGEQEIADLIRRLEIDIAVDLMGHTQDERFGVFARRPAPIQVSYLGYLGTTGAEFIDYVIADKIALPFDQQPYFTEKIVHLPDCFLATDDRQEIAALLPSRAEAGLPPAGFVFCSFNNSYKFARPMFAAWMRLLRAVDGSVLWLLQSNEDMAANLRREAQNCGVDPNRLVFARHIPLAQHLARQRLAGLFLDTAPYNAGATAVAALWSGLPVATLIGETFVGRMAASMLDAVGLPELAVGNLDAYEALARELATNPDRMTSIARKLRCNLGTAPLFDTARFARHIEAAYRTMWERHRSGETPRAFAVDRVH